MPMQDKFYYLSMFIRKYISSQASFKTIFENYTQGIYDFETISELTKEPMGFMMPGELFKLKELSKNILEYDFEHELMIDNTSDNMKNNHLTKILNADISSIFHTARAVQEDFYKNIYYDKNINIFKNFNLKSFHELEDYKEFTFENIKTNLLDINSLFESSNFLIEKIVQQNKNQEKIVYSFFENLDNIEFIFGTQRTFEIINSIYGSQDKLIEKYLQSRKRNGFFELANKIEKNLEDRNLILAVKKTNLEHKLHYKNLENANNKDHFIDFLNTSDDTQIYNGLENNLNFYYKRLKKEFSKSSIIFNQFYEKYHKTQKVQSEDYEEFEFLSKEPTRVLQYKGGLLYNLKSTSHIIRKIESNSYKKHEISDEKIKFVKLLDTTISSLFHTTRATKEEAYRNYKYSNIIQEISGYKKLTNFEKNNIETLVETQKKAKEKLNNHVETVYKMFNNIDNFIENYNCFL